MPGRKSYVEVLRDEREPEFAPPSMYFEVPKNRQQHASDIQRIKRLHASLKTANEDLTSPTNSGNDNLLLSSRCDAAEDKPQGNSRTEEFIQEYNSSGGEKYQTGEQLPETNPSVAAEQHNQTNGNTDGANNWIGSYYGHEHVQYYGNQSVQAGQYAYAQPEIYVESPNVQQYQGYHHYLPLQQQQDTSQWQSAQYVSNTVPHQQYNVDGACNQQQTQFTNAGFSSGAVATGVSNTSMSASMQSGVSVEPRKPKIPKMAVVDTRYMKNEDMPSVQPVAVHAPSVTAIPYIPGSFTAAKQATDKLYEESVAESGLKNQISGNPLLYTAVQLARQELLPPENGDVTTV